MLHYDTAGIIQPEEGIIEFEILPEHLKLLRAMQIEWPEDYWGAPRVNVQRPYGTRDVHADICHILEQEMTDKEAEKLHCGAGMALQIILKTGKFKASKYRSSKFGQDWKEYNVKLRGKRKSTSDSIED